MHTFRVCLDDDGLGEARTVEFDAHGPDFVFNVLSTQYAGRTAELWRGEELLGKLRRTPADVWEFEPAAGQAPLAA